MQNNRRSFLAFLTTILTLLLAVMPSSADAAPERPLIFIPGILGSRLCDVSTGEVVWGELPSYSRFSELALPIDGTSAPLRHKACGIIEQIEVLGPWKVHQYDDLIETLRSLGYTKGVDLFVFDYDWRLSNSVTAAALAAKIAEWRLGGDFDIVAHSMGGLVARLLIDKPEFAGRVKRLVTLSTPYRGSAETFRVLDKGFGFWQNLAARGMETVRLTALTFPSAYELLPNYPKGACCRWRMGAENTEFDPLDPQVWARFAFVPSEFKDEKGSEWLRATLFHARALQGIFGSDMPAGVRSYPVAAGLIGTDFRVTIDSGTGEFVGFQQVRGDGTVIVNSATNWNPAEIRPSTNEHARLFANDAVRQLLRYVFVGDKDDTSGRMDGPWKLNDGRGGQIDLTSVSYEAIPQIVAPGEPARFNLSLLGATIDSARALAAADLSGIEVRIDDMGAVPLTAAVGTADDTGVTLHFDFAAPAAEGSHVVYLTLPGMAELQDVFVVLPTGGAAK
ncbi:hypothetical protein GOL39_26600 [Sinorhizobium medicae]|uniref:lipase family alpha/beta hydrolase n=1 Tax=Sinorhizobium medicae TaxID=110321 RepID=UPI000C7D65F2|nr:hypothetical protein [Sinorhizobium medicae]MDX0425127.1 hypothetical protein [Sinorhizobium medicae]MDX0974130.1 hypothetical protein [Sinorhizobium medicae]MDX1146152.1 hypothetical protein [Sinorhizobium medicae]PLU51908.1 hypothetical protein BMJ23_25435 [Sinorhizobium medicae]TWA20454.1 lecithin:cholesterol acyltransferase [Sinorhizobium medicae]